MSDEDRDLVLITKHEASVVLDLVEKAAKRHDGVRFRTGEYVDYSMLAEKLSFAIGDE